MTAKVGPPEGSGGIENEFGRPEFLMLRAEDLPELLTKKQVAAFFQVSTSTIDNRIKPGSKGYWSEFPTPQPLPYEDRWSKEQILAFVKSRFSSE